MGQCYSVAGRVIPQDLYAATQALKEYIINTSKSKNIKYNLGEYFQIGLSLEKFCDLMHIILTDQNYYHDPTTNSYQSDFTASYSWDGVILGAFKVIAPYLDPMSYLDVDVDEVSYHLWIQDGQMVIEEIDDEENEDENEEEEEIPLPW